MGILLGAAATGAQKQEAEARSPVGPLPWPLGPGGCCGGQEGADRDTIPGKPLPHVLTLSLATSQKDTQPQPEADAQVGAHGGTHGVCPVEGRPLSQPCLSAPPDHKASFSIHTLVGGGLSPCRTPTRAGVETPGPVHCGPAPAGASGSRPVALLPPPHASGSVTASVPIPPSGQSPQGSTGPDRCSPLTLTRTRLGWTLSGLRWAG